VKWHHIPKFSVCSNCCENLYVTVLKGALETPYISSVQSWLSSCCLYDPEVQKQRKKTGLQTRRKHKIIIMISFLPSNAVAIFCSSELFRSLLLLYLLANKCLILYIPLTITLQPPIEWYLDVTPLGWGGKQTYITFHETLQRFAMCPFSIKKLRKGKKHESKNLYTQVSI